MCYHIEENARQFTIDYYCGRVHIIISLTRIPQLIVDAFTPNIIKISHLKSKLPQTK